MAVVVGSALVDKKAVKEGNYSLLRRRAKQFFRGGKEGQDIVRRDHEEDGKG